MPSGVYPRTKYMDGRKEILEIKADWVCRNERNVAKFTAAKQYCETNGFKFNVWTEQNLTR